MTTRTAVLAHVHFWRIDPPTGPTSHGRCRECGETKEFRNRLSPEEEMQASHARPPKGFVYRIEHTNVLWR